MKRRLVNLVVNNYAERFYSLRRIDPYNQFFYRSAKAALDAADEAAKKQEAFPAMQTGLQLPPPCANFTSPNLGGNMGLFVLLSPRGTSQGRIVYADRGGGVAALYDADKNSHNTLGRLNDPKGIDPVCLPVVNPGDPGQSIMYVLDREPRRPAHRCFEVLESVPTEAAALDNYRTTWWRWRLLRPPPFVFQDGYRPSTITSYATVDCNGCSTIYISVASGIGTYSFERARLDSISRQSLGWRQTEEWSRVGAWMLPFTGRAQYVPDFKLWFGFLDSSPNHLCAVDLSATHHEQRPTPLHVWQDLNPPEGEEWLPGNTELLNLGDGKFLTVKTFEEERNSQEFAVLTGIEMMMDGDQSLQMVKHKCMRFDFDTESIEWVL